MNEQKPFQPGDTVVCVEPGPTSLCYLAWYIVDYATVGGVKVQGHPCAWYDVTRFRNVEEKR